MERAPLQPPPAKSFDELCQLRARVGKLLDTHWQAMLHFAVDISSGDDGRRGSRRIRGFVHLAGAKPSSDARVSLASTATCVRSVRLCPDRLWRQLDFSPLAEEIRHRHGSQRLATMGLPHLNAFTVGQVVSVFRHISIAESEPVATDCRQRLDELVQEHGTSLAGFPPNGYLTYWVLAAARSAGISLRSSTPLVRWAEHEFYRQLALLSAGDEEEGDAFQLAYNLVSLAAFLPSALRPTTIPHSLWRLSETQLPRGVWEKKEPLFVWEKRGDAYCFSFELLSTLLLEFRDRYEHLRHFDGALERALEWAERNAHIEDESEALTWRSGHRTESKAPESWATAEVYAFLRRYEHYLNYRINTALLAKYGGAVEDLPDPNAFRVFYQPEVRSSTRAARTNRPLFGEVLISHILEPLRIEPDAKEYSLARNSEAHLLLRSGILFGPPGTGKSSFVRAIARYLGWPLIVLDPSDFARDGLHLLPTTIGRIFSDLREARDTVIFLDEMEELMRDRRSDSRGNQDMSFEQRLLTTALLPKLQDLHDQAQSIFFVATNHFARIDEAARRFGRFDVTVEVLPACFDEKCRQIIDTVVEAQSDPEDSDSQAFVSQLEEALGGLSTADRSDERFKIEWATFGEVRNLASRIVHRQGLGRRPGEALLDVLERFVPALDPDEWKEGHVYNKIG